MSKLKLELRHRAQLNEAYDEKHAKFINNITELESPWCLDKAFSLPDMGGELLVSFPLSKIFGRGVNGRITYVCRSEEYLEDNAQYDDHIQIEFNDGRFDLGEVIKVLQVYIPAFDCYRATVHNWDITRSDWPKVVEECNSSGKDINGRDGVYRINAINYFDRELCLRAFSLSPEQIIQRLDGKVEFVSLFNDGLFLIYSSQLLEKNVFLNIDKEIKQIIGDTRAR